MKIVEMLPNGKLKVEIDKEEYMSNYQGNDNYITDPPNATPDGAWKYFKIIDKVDEKDNAINFAILDNVRSIRLMMIFFVVLTVLNIIASAIILLR